MSVRPQPEPWRRPGPHSSHQPAASRKNGSSQRMVPNHGANTPVHHEVRLPSPGRVNAMRVIAPTTSSDRPTIERTTSGEMRLYHAGPEALRRGFSGGGGPAGG